MLMIKHYTLKDAKDDFPNLIVEDYINEELVLVSHLFRIYKL